MADTTDEIRLANFPLGGDVSSVTKFFADLGNGEVAVTAWGILQYISANGGGLVMTSGAPSSATGLDGQVAFDPAAGLFYGPKAGGAWTSGVPLNLSADQIAEINTAVGSASSSAEQAALQAGIGAAANRIYATASAGVATDGTGVAAGEYYYVPSSSADASYDVWRNVAGVATRTATALPSAAAVAPASQLATIVPASTFSSYGKTPVTGTAPSGANFFTLESQTLAAGYLSSVSVWLMAAGTVVIVALTRSADGTFNLVDTRTIASVPIGATTFAESVDYAPLYVPEGGLIAIYTPTAGGAALAYITGTAQPHFASTQSAGNIPSNFASTRDGMTEMSFGFTIRSVAVVRSQLSATLENRVATGELGAAQISTIASSQMLGIPSPRNRASLAPATATTFIFGTTAAAYSAADSVAFYAASTGIIKLKVFRPLSATTVAFVEERTITVARTGLTVFRQGVDYDALSVPAGYYVGIGLPATGAASFTYGIGSGFAFYTIGSDTTADNVALGTLGTANAMSLNVRLSSVIVPDTALSAPTMQTLTTAGALAAALRYGAASVGRPSPMTGAVIVPTGTTYFFATPSPIAVRITSVTINIRTAGTVAIKAMLLNGDGTFDVLGQQVIAATATGEYTFDATNGFIPFDLPVGGVIGMYAPVSGGLVANYTTGLAGYPFYQYPGNASGTHLTLGALSSANALDIRYAYTNLTVPVTALQRDAQNDYVKSRRADLETVADFSTLPRGWVNSGSFTLANGVATSTTTGLANQLRSGGYFGASKRVIRWKFQFTAAGSIAAFLTNPIEGATQAGGIVTVDMTDNTVKRWTRYTGSNTPTVLETIPLGFTLALDAVYCLDIETSGRTVTLRVWDTSGNGYVTDARTATPWGWSTYGVSGDNLYDQGMMHGAPGVAALAGGVSISFHDHWMRARPRPHIYLAGDSITEGFAVTDAEKYATLIENMFPAGEVVSSGVGGTVSQGLYNRMQSELLHMRPRVVYVFIGTNADAALATNLEFIRTFVQNIVGATLVVATVPRYASATAIVNALPASVVRVRLDLAMMSAGAGSSDLPNFFTHQDADGTTYDDTYHPNALGHQQMVTRMMLDAPQMFV